METRLKNIYIQALSVSSFLFLVLSSSLNKIYQFATS